MRLLVTRKHKICWVILNTGERLEAALNFGQYFKTADDGITLQLWQEHDPPTSTHLGRRVLLQQCPLQKVRYLLTEPEAELLCDPCLRQALSAGDLIRVIVLKDGRRVEAADSEFFQTNRAGDVMHLWHLEPGSPAMREDLWYDTEQGHVKLRGHWQREDVLWPVSTYALQSARSRGLLRSLLG